MGKRQSGDVLDEIREVLVEHRDLGRAVHRNVDVAAVVGRDVQGFRESARVPVPPPERRPGSAGRAWVGGSGDAAAPARVGRGRAENGAPTESGNGIFELYFVFVKRGKVRKRGKKKGVSEQGGV